jgi:hypothetical protein
MVLVLRSKNAGVWHITIDIIFKNKEFYELAKKKLSSKIFCDIYNKQSVEYFECDSINTLKISFLRSKAAGSIHDTDCLGANFYIPLLEIDL